MYIMQKIIYATFSIRNQRLDSFVLSSLDFETKKIYNECFTYTFSCIFIKIITVIFFLYAFIKLPPHMLLYGNHIIYNIFPVSILFIY